MPLCPFVYLMEPFCHLSPSATTHKTPSSRSLPRRSDLQSVTSEWLSLTLDPSTPTLDPPTLPSGFTPFTKAPSSSSSPADLSMQPQELFRIPHFKQGQQSLAHSPHIYPPLPFLKGSCPPPDLSLQSSAKGTAQTRHISKPELMFCTEPEPVKSPTPPRPPHSLKNSHLRKTDPYDELLSVILQACTGQDEAVVSERPQSISNPKRGPPHPHPVSPVETDPPPTQNEPVVKFPVKRPPVVKRSCYTELFIEEEEESVREKEEEVLGCRERAPPQVEHGVCAASAGLREENTVVDCLLG